MDYPSAQIGRLPFGFSGCGIWFHKSTPKVWHPNLQLAGICTSYYRRSRMLSGLKVEAVAGFLERILP